MHKNQVFPQLDYGSLLKRGSFGASVAIVSLLLLCFALSAFFSNAVNEEISGIHELAKLSDQWVGETAGELFGVPEAVMFSNLVNSKLSVNGFSDKISGGAWIKSGFIPLLIIPFISLGIGGYLAARRMKAVSAAQTLPVSAMIALFYALFLLVMDWLAGGSYRMERSFFILTVEGSVEYSFSWGSALLNGLVLGFLFSWTGSLLYGRQTSRSSGSGAIAVHQALLTVVQGLAIASVSGLVLLFLNKEEGTSFGALLLLAPQLGSYIWGIANLGTFSLVQEGEYFAGSVWSGLEGSLDWGGPLASPVIHVLVRLSPLLTLAVLLWAGKRMFAYGGSGAAHLGRSLVFSAVYSLTTAFLVFISKLELHVNGNVFSLYETHNELFRAGAQAMPVLICSFVLSLAVTVLGMLWFNRVRGGSASTKAQG
ncbi:MAG: hypothetical protein K0R57_726 [Paenibacillaceae bacterium]|jgi:hypothetical protein|nr:hypothetical protein [Paenibacillaceae bacterium]